MGVACERYALHVGCRDLGAMPSQRNALDWRKRAAAGRRAIPRSIASGSARGPPRSRSAHRAGLALWIDYGLPRRHYYFPQRRDGTLICHFRQRAILDPFIAPGLLDITAWVDFTRLAQASAACGYALAGFTTQAHFLAGLSIDARDAPACRRRPNALRTARERSAHASAARRDGRALQGHGLDARHGVAAARHSQLQDLRHTL